MAGLTTDKDLNDLIEESLAEGFTIERTGSGHLKWTPPNYPEAAFTTASSPTSPRVVEHAKLQKRRALAGYSERLPPDQKQAALLRMAQQNEERKKAQAVLRASPFRKLLRVSKRPEILVPQVERGPTGKEAISMFTAAKKARELSANTGKTIDICAQNIASVFDVMTPAKTKTDAQSIINIVNRKRTPKASVIPEHEELIGKIRSALRMPLDKEAKIYIINGLLEQNL